MDGITIGCTRVAADAHDLPARREILVSLGAQPDRFSFDRGLTGRVFFDTLESVADFDADLMRVRTREGLALAQAKGRLRGRQPKLTALQQRHLLELHDTGEHSQAEIAHLFRISRSTVYRAIQRRGPEPVPSP